ncbi:MAG: hypothetical protein IPP07_29015 [Holophagales bacterium]|jgi:hypothetical protein|nr:hypothetical protein [Holophagales bacterium]
MKTITVPAGVPRDFIRSMKALLPEVVFVEVLPPASTAIVPAKTEIHAKEAGVWLDLLPGLLAAGATILCPVAWLPFVTAAVRIGVPKIRALIEGTPTQERWPLAAILALEAEVDALPDPLT